jgi:hypothetical protein
MPNSKKDTTKRTRDRTLVYWAFGLILAALALLILGRLMTDSLENETTTQEIRLDSEPNGLEITTDGLENATGSTLPDLSTEINVE